MSDFLCPKCGGDVVFDWPAEELGKCAGCGFSWSDEYLDGYWTRDREDQERRCNGCKLWHQPEYLSYGHCPVQVMQDGRFEKPPAGFGCKRWEKK